MSAGPIPDGLRAYLPTSYFQADGTTLKPGVDAAKATEVAMGIQAKAGAMPPAEAGLFLAMVGRADLAPDGKIPTDIDAAIDAYASAANFVGTLAIGSNALDYLARAMVEQAAEQRKNALNDRLAAREIAKGELLVQAGKLNEEADKLSSSALTSMIITVVMSSISIAASVGGAVAGGFAAVKQAGAFSSAIKGGASFGEAAQGATAAAGKTASIAQSAGTSLNALASSANQLGGGISGYVSQKGQSDAKNIEADGQRAAAQAQETQASGDVRKEQQQALDQMVQAIIQFLKDLKEAKAQQMQALTRV